MRMLNPSPGECVDRQTILQLKAEYGQSPKEQKTIDVVKKHEVTQTEETAIIKTKFEGASKVNIQPFLDEHEAIQRYLEAKWFPDIADSQSKQDGYDDLYTELSEVNGSLWKLEDQSRVLRRSPERNADTATRAEEILHTISSLNDKRAELVKQINSLWGMNTQEKLHIGAN